MIVRLRIVLKKLSMQESRQRDLKLSWPTPIREKTITTHHVYPCRDITVFIVFTGTSVTAGVMTLSLFVVGFVILITIVQVFLLLSSSDTASAATHTHTKDKIKSGERKYQKPFVRAVLNTTIYLPIQSKYPLTSLTHDFKSFSSAVLLFSFSLVEHSLRCYFSKIGGIPFLSVLKAQLLFTEIIQHHRILLRYQSHTAMRVNETYLISGVWTFLYMLMCVGSKTEID